mgnify:CR=1 FL=1
MNKSELVEVAAQEAGITKAAADKALSAIIGAVVKTVSKGESVTLVGFGTFKSAKRAARTGKNPKTGATLKIAATTVPIFRCVASRASCPSRPDAMAPEPPMSVRKSIFPWSISMRRLSAATCANWASSYSPPIAICP